MAVVQKLRTFVLVAACVLPLFVPAAAFAQQYKANDKIEYKATTFPAETWEVGTFVRLAGNNSQAIIREKPSEFYPAGFQRAYDLTDIRPLPAPAPVAAAPNQPGLPAALPMPGMTLPPPLAMPGMTLPPPLPMPGMAMPPPLAMPGMPAPLPMPGMPLPPPLGMPPGLPPGPPAEMKAGDKIEYKASSWPEDRWQIGTFVRKASNGLQVIIRETPNEFYPEGFQKAYDNADVRPLAKPPGQDENDFAASCGDDPSAQEPPRSAAPMSQDDVLAFLRARMPTGDPFRNPKRDKFLEELRWEILSRGVAFRYETLGRFSNELGKYGALSNVTAALADNFGPPARLDELLGTWRMLKVGVTTRIEKGGKAHDNLHFGKAGSIEVNPDRTYAWHLSEPPLQGQWRPATSEELAKSDKGGEGIVILNGKDKAPWLIFKRDENAPQGQGIKIVDLNTRNLRERGTR